MTLLDGMKECVANDIFRRGDVIEDTAGHVFQFDKRDGGPMMQRKGTKWEVTGADALGFCLREFKGTAKLRYPYEFGYWPQRFRIIRRGAELLKPVLPPVPPNGDWRVDARKRFVEKVKGVGK